MSSCNLPLEHNRLVENSDATAASLFIMPVTLVSCMTQRLMSKILLLSQSFARERYGYGEALEAARTAASLLDWRNMFCTGMFIPIAGSYNENWDAVADLTG